MTSRRALGALAALLMPLAACTSEPPLAEKLATANGYMREHAGDAAYRALAYDLYRDVVAASDDPALTRDAHFGLGAIAVFDLLQGVGSLLAPLPVTPAAADASDEDSVPLPPISQLVGVIDTALHQLLETGIVDHWGELVTLDDYHFTFAEGAAVIQIGDAATVDFSGEWDLTEIRLIYGVLQIALTTGELILAYDGVLDVVLEAAFSDAEIPELPSNPADIPQWLVDAATTAGLDPLPWLDADFGVLNADAAQLQAMRDRMALGTAQLAAAFAYALNEDDDQDDEFAPVDPGGKYLGNLLAKLLGEDAEILATIGNVLPGAADLRDTFTALDASVRSDTPFVLPPSLWEFLSLALSVLSWDGASPPRDPVGLRIPALRISRLFTQPIPDLKDRETGLLPYYCVTAAEVAALDCAGAGSFVVRSEQEPYDDANDDGNVAGGEFDDAGVDGFVDLNDDGVADAPAAGRPGAGDGIWWGPIALNAGDPALDDAADASLQPGLAHASPTAGAGYDPSNGIVDPVYMFLPNPDLNGLLVPIVDTDPDPNDAAYAADATGTVSNGDVMRFLSSVVWLLESDTLSSLSEE